MIGAAGQGAARQREREILGTLIHGPASVRIAVADTLLAHLQFVITNKLRRRESFTVVFTESAADGRRSVWLSDSIPLIFEYESSERRLLDRSRIDAMMVEALGANGLQVDTEADAPSAAPLVDDL
ncbi:MAG: ATP-dependent DNA ligase [Actinomycetota bacterium]|nr:ATP-dependent DNA ligase [Actinomycetota bacterium]